MAQLDFFKTPQRPWNARRVVGAKPPLQPRHVWAIRQHLRNSGRVRDLALFNCAIDGKLRACDLVRLTVGDIALGGEVRSRAVVVQRKTGRPVMFELTPVTREALVDWLAARPKLSSNWLFPSRSRAGEPISTRQYARLVDEWISAIQLNPATFGTHSLRRTKVSMIYKKTGNLRACQLLLGHAKLESTVRYLGVDVDDALAMAEQIDL